MAQPFAFSKFLLQLGKLVKMRPLRSLLTKIDALSKKIGLSRTQPRCAPCTLDALLLKRAREPRRDTRQALNDKWLRIGAEPPALFATADKGVFAPPVAKNPLRVPIRTQPLFSEPRSEKLK